MSPCCICHRSQATCRCLEMLPIRSRSHRLRWEEALKRRNRALWAWVVALSMSAAGLVHLLASLL